MDLRRETLGAGGRNVLFAPEALARLTSGFDRLAAALAVTLGPMQGPVLSARGSRSVEALSDAATIARRVVELPDRGQNAGAMILRHLAWRMHEQFGDGAATAAVLARAMVREAGKRIAAGVDPTLIRGGLEHALPSALAALAAQAEPIQGPDVLAGIATGITGDPELGAVLGEIVDLLGPDAALTFEEFPVPFLDREYVEGAYWRAHPAARAMIPDGRAQVVLQRPLIMLADQELHDGDDVLPALELTARSDDRRPLLVIPAKIGDRALTAITANHSRGTVTAIVALLGSSGPELTDDLHDLAVLTSGNVISELLGRPPRRLRWDDLGTASKAVLSRDSLTIGGGAGDPNAVAARSSTLRRRSAGREVSEDERRRLQARVARLSGGMAILKIGAHTATELTHRRGQAEKAFRVLSGTLAEGLVPGGGVAFLQCIPAVKASRGTCAMPGLEHGVDALASALAAPFTQIVRNRGLVHPLVALETAGRLGCGFGLDVLTGEYVDLRQRRICDSLRVTRGALQAATSAAISVLTTGVFVLPPESKRALRVTP